MFNFVHFILYNVVVCACEHDIFIKNLVSMFTVLFQGGEELEAVQSAELNAEDGIGDSENEGIEACEDSDGEMDSDEEQQRYFI
jgi:hypothetical protein